MNQKCLSSCLVFFLFTYPGFFVAVFLSFDIGIKNLGVVYGVFHGKRASVIKLSQFAIHHVDCLEVASTIKVRNEKLVELLYASLNRLMKDLKEIQQKLELDSITHIFTENQPRSSSKKLCMMSSLIYMYFIGDQDFKFHNVSSSSKCKVVHQNDNLSLSEVISFASHLL